MCWYGTLYHKSQLTRTLNKKTKASQQISVNIEKNPLWLFVSFAKDWVTKNHVKNEEHGKQVKTPIKRQCFKFTLTTRCLLPLVESNAIMIKEIEISKHMLGMHCGKKRKCWLYLIYIFLGLSKRSFKNWKTNPF